MPVGSASCPLGRPRARWVGLMPCWVGLMPVVSSQGLDFEHGRRRTLIIAVKNEVPFEAPLATSTATVIIDVEDLNEAPIFEPEQKLVVKPEDLPVGSEIAFYTAVDPDVEMMQNIS